MTISKLTIVIILWQLSKMTIGKWQSWQRFQWQLSLFLFSSESLTLAFPYLYVSICLSCLPPNLLSQSWLLLFLHFDQASPFWYFCHLWHLLNSENSNACFPMLLYYKTMVAQIDLLSEAKHRRNRNLDMSRSTPPKGGTTLTSPFSIEK